MTQEDSGITMTEKMINIRPSRWEDLKQFYEWELQENVKQFFSIRDGQTFEEVVRTYVASDEDPAQEQFTIELDGVMIGRIVLADIIKGWKGELLRIYIGDAGNRGAGYGRQAMEWVMDHCFRELSLQRLYLDYYTGNPAQFLYEKLGFQHEGMLRKNCRKNGVLYDVHLMSMLAEEYAARRGVQ